MARSLGHGPRDPQEAHRVASPLELFSDLCYVVAIAQAAAQLHHAVSAGHVLHGVLYFAIAFYAIWWAWLNFAWFNSAYDPDDVPHRLLTLLQVFGSLVLAAGIPRMFHEDFVLGVSGYVIMRIGLVLMWLRAAIGHPARRRTALRYAGGLLVVQSAWAVLAFIAHGHIPLAVIALVAIGDILVPVFAEQAGPTPWHPHHIAERYGLMFIIVLGEAVLSVTASLQGAFDSAHPPAGLWLIVSGGVLTTFSAWWIYFAREAADFLRRNDASEFVFGFGHYVVYAAVAALGAGLAVRVDVISGHARIGAWGGSAAVTVPAALLVLSMWFAHVRLSRPGLATAVPFLVAAGLLVGLTWAPASEAWTGVVFVALLVKEAAQRNEVHWNRDLLPGSS